MRVYLDHNATTRLCASAASAMGPWLAAGAVGNASSVHAEGRRARDAVEAAREAVATAIGLRSRADVSGLVFTSGATEANHLALNGLMPERPHVVTSAAEHPSVLEVARARGPGLVTVIPVGPDGRVDPAEVVSALRSDTGLVSIHAANNETGVLQDVPALACVCRARDVPLHVDAAQVLGRLPLDVTTWGADLVTLSAHKAHGPIGAGALWVRRGLRLVPWLRGGPQERGRRAGTETVAAIVGCGAAALACPTHLAEMPRVAALCQRLLDGLAVLDASITRVGALERLPNTLSLAFPGRSGEALVMALDLHGVAASTGAACSVGSVEASPVLLAMGLTPSEARSVVRLSLGAETTSADVDHTLLAFEAVLSRGARA